MATRQVFSVEESALADLLADDDELNHTNTPTAKKQTHPAQPSIEIQIPDSTFAVTPPSFQDTDSVSTFHPRRPQMTTQPSQGPNCSPTQAFLVFHPTVVSDNS
jgi:hypothetical protein